MQLGMLNKIDQDLNNSRNNKNAQNSPSEDPQESNDLKTKHRKRYRSLKSLFRETLATLPEPKTDRSKLK